MPSEGPYEDMHHHGGFRERSTQLKPPFNRINSSAHLRSLHDGLAAVQDDIKNTTGPLPHAESARAFSVAEPDPATAHGPASPPPRAPQRH